MASNDTPDFGTFSKDGRTKTASTQADRVALKFNGWTETSPPSSASIAEVEQAIARAESTSGKGKGK